MRRRRPAGLSMAMVLAASIVVVTLGLALGTKATVNLNFSRDNLAGAQAELLARSVVSQLLADMDARMESANAVEFDVVKQPLVADIMDLPGRLKQPIFAPGGDAPKGEVTITLDPTQPYYSVVNLDSEFPARGWTDRYGMPNSVPPFSVSLVITTRLGNSVRHFEAVLKREWPYAVYLAEGKLKIGGRAVVEGSTYALSGPETPGQVVVSAAELHGDLCTRRDLANNPFTLIDGGLLSGRQRFEVAVGRKQRTSYYWDARTANGVLRLLRDPDLDDREVVNVPLSDVAVPMLALSPNKDGQVMLGTEVIGRTEPGKSGIPGGLWAPNTDVPLVMKSSYSYYASSSVNEDYLRQCYFLGKPLDLRDGVYQINHPLANRARQWVIQPNLKDFKVKLRDTGGRMVADNGRLILNDAVLFVKGDLDLRSIEGDNSVLVVDGHLTLDGGRLDAKDKGMVIQADHVLFSSSGDFRGLIVAKGPLEATPSDPNERLRIRGALLAESGMDIMGTDVIHDAKYTRVFNRFGEFRLTRFRAIK